MKRQLKSKGRGISTSIKVTVTVALFVTLLIVVFWLTTKIFAMVYGVSSVSVLTGQTGI